MLLFDTTVFKQKLEEINGIECVESDFFGVHTSISMHDVEAFHKIMVAQTAEDLEDVSLEDIMKAFDHVKELGDYYTLGPDKNKSLPACMKRFKTTSSALRRRVL